MEQEFFILTVAIFAAAALQSATGIGFGVIAGPILLVVLNDNSAIQISIILNLLIAALLAPSLRQKAERRLLAQLLLGLAIGSPLGLLLYLQIGIGLLKAFAGVVVLFTLIMVVRGKRTSCTEIRPTSGKLETISIGVVAGLMGGSLAMPGPIPAAWMSARGFGAEAVRATILLMFVFAYTVALLLQFSMAGINADTLWFCLIHSPSTIAGVLVGGFLSRQLSQQIFHGLLIVILIATVVILFSTLG